jgi:endonuclease G
MHYNGSQDLPEPLKPHPNAQYHDPQGGAKPYDIQESVTPEAWKNLVDALYTHRRKLLSIPGVTAVDLGYKIRDHKFTDELALRVHVEQKLPPEVFDTRPRELILKETEEPKHPEQRYLDSNGTRVPMDVIEADYKLVQIGEAPRRGAVLEKPLENGEVNRRRRLDPLVGGVSIGSPQTPAGTLGALVWDREDGSICILSNWHVLAGDLRAEVGNPCFQPGLFDQGRSTDVVARLKRWSFNRKTDAAIAELTGSRRYSTGEILDMFQTIKGVADHLYLGMTVHKSGRSSSHDGLYFSSAIAYSNGVVRVFEEQIHIAPLTGYSISEPGDSGSVWVTNASDEGYLAVGLHFAGDLPHSSFGEYALANPMSVVARRLNFSFRPLFLEIRDEPMTPPQPPPFAQPVKIQLGNAAQPMSIVLNGLTRSGPEPEDDKMGAGG